MKYETYSEYSHSESGDLRFRRRQIQQEMVDAGRLLRTSLAK